jgi:hypothetical protein
MPNPTFETELNSYLKRWVTMDESEILVKSMIEDPLLFKRIFKSAFKFETPNIWRIWWYIDRASEQKPEILEPYVSILAESLPKLPNSSVRRHFTRMLIRHNIPEENMGMVVDKCFEWLLSNEPVAVKANSLQVLYNITLTEPDLKGELIAAIESQYEEGSKGFKNKARKMLKNLRENIKNKN